MAIIVIFLVSIFKIYWEREKTNLFVFKYLLFCSMTESSASVCHVIHQNSDPVFDIPDQHHCGHFIGLLPLLVNKCKVHVQSVRNGGHSVTKKSHLLFKIVWDVWFTICLQTGIPNFSIKYQNVIRNTCTCPTLPNELLYSWSNYSSISLGLICFKLDLFAPPASGETIQLFLHSGIVSLIHFRTAGSAYRLSTGMSKNPWQYLTTAILAIIKCRF